MPTKIEWTDETWNPVRARRLMPDGTVRIGWHCEHASPGCAKCYAEKLNLAGRSAFTGTRLPYKPGHRKDVEVYLDEKKLLEPLRWRRPRKIFVCSMTDLFGEFVTDEMLDRVFAVMALCPQHVFQVLTKRSARMREYLTDPERPLQIIAELMGCLVESDDPEADERLWQLQQRLADKVPAPLSERWPLPNVWLGVSVEDQKRADERIPDLLATPAAVRFLSCEPLLGPVDLTFLDLTFVESREAEASGLVSVNALDGLHFDAEGSVPGIYDSPDPHIAWVICGGESGPNARPMHPDWARSLRDQCAAAGVPFFFKQWGQWGPAGQVSLDPMGSGRRPAFAGWVGAAHQDWWIDEAGAPDDADRFAPDDSLWLVGKKAAGRLLDGVEHNGMPEARHA